MNIEDKGNALVVVTYKDWEALDDAGCSNAGAPNYTATGIFFWDETTNQLGTEKHSQTKVLSFQARYGS